MSHPWKFMIGFVAAVSALAAATTPAPAHGPTLSTLEATASGEIPPSHAFDHSGVSRALDIPVLLANQGEILAKPSQVAAAPSAELRGPGSPRGAAVTKPVPPEATATTQAGSNAQEFGEDDDGEGGTPLWQTILGLVSIARGAAIGAAVAGPLGAAIGALALPILVGLIIAIIKLLRHSASGAPGGVDTRSASGRS